MADDLLSAISSAIDSAGGSPPPQEAAPDAQTETDDPQPAVGDDSAAAAAAGSSENAGSDTAAGAAGADASKESDAAAASDAAGAGEGPAAAAKNQPAAAAAGKDGVKSAEQPAAKKQPDPINDPIDERLKPATKERITSLVTVAKTLTAERDEARGQFQEIITAIQDTRASPEQYAQALDYLRMVNSPNVADREACLAFMQQEMRALAVSLGKPVPGVDLLSEHADLQQRVQNGEISQQDAEELAAARSQRVGMQRAGAAASAEQQAAQARQQAVQQGAQALNALEAQLSAADPTGYAAKKAILAPALKKALRGIDPSMWAETFKAAYDGLQLPAAPAPVAAPRAAAPAQQPLRAGNPAGGAKPAPSNMYEALWGSKG